MRWNPSIRRFGAVLVVCALGVTCGRDAADEPDRPAGIQTRAVATALPAGATVVVSGFDLRSFWSRLEASRLYQELQAVEGVHTALAPLAESRREFEAETGLPLNEETLMTLFGEKFDLGFYGTLAEDRADLLLVAEVADEARARTILQTLETRVAQEEGASFQDEEIAGKSIRVATTAEGEQVLFYLLEDDRLTISTTQNRLQAALMLAEDGEGEAMSESEAYTEVLRKLPEATIAVYVDQRAVREAAQRAAADTTRVGGSPDEQLQRERLAAATSVLEQYDPVRSTAVGIYWTDSGIRGDVYARFTEGERSAIVEMLSRSPSAIRSLTFQPVGTLLYGAINSIDARALYDELTNYAVDATRIQIGVKNTPDSLRADSLVASQIAAFEAETGIDVEEDILSWVGEEAAFAITGVDRSGFFPLPETAFTIATRNSERSREFLSEMEGLVTETARTRASIPLAWQSETYEGQTIRYAPTPLGEGLSVAYVVTDDFVVVASSRGLARRMLAAREGSADALPSNPNFSAMTRFYPQQVSALGFVNVEQILTEVQSLMSTYGEMTGGAAAADTASTTGQVIAALKNAPRLGFYSAADEGGVFGHFLLEVQ
ncbi:MAG TPA: DUF3352 domain-containing protein [Gemmatimonadota bacterium]|nr:DUF3352 domain-containing protein [Gemmatimonadota bacterium]